MLAEPVAPADPKLRRLRLRRRYAWMLVGMLVFLAAMFALERAGMPRTWIAVTFLLAPVVLYASIGLACRTSDSTQYFVAGRSVPAVYNGMAIAADWMSVATFMGLAGLLYVNGFAGLAYVLGWTGGFCLVAFYVAPYLRKSGQFTIPDFLGERYGARLPRLVGLIVTALCSLMYVVAQIYGVGLITSRLTGLTFEIGIFVGLGGVLVCSFLGGMRAVTWTQVAQYMILVVAFLVPVVWLSYKQTGNPLPQAALGPQLQKVTEREKALLADEGERQVAQAFQREADRYAQRLLDVDKALAEDRLNAQRELDRLRQSGASPAEMRGAQRTLQTLPIDAAAAREAWTRARAVAQERARQMGGMPRQALAYAGDPRGDTTQTAAFAHSRLDFVALVFCLMAGTAGMPHILARFYTTPTVREARRSVTWALLFIVLLYICAPVLAVLLKVEVLGSVVGLRIDELPRWINDWSRVDPGLVSVVDINHDGVLQLGELRISGDVLVLATPEIGGMPFVVSCLVAAGGMAAALSTADGLLLTIANALSHDLYFRLIDERAPVTRRVALSKVILLLFALAAAWIAIQKPAAILLLVTPVFSIAAATIFPALVMGVFWKGANRWGATAGMGVGLVLTLYYMLSRQNAPAADLWWGIQPTSAGVFGVPAAFAALVLVSLWTGKSSGGEFVDALRRPDRA
jgi:cation/acetate symporter